MMRGKWFVVGLLSIILALRLMLSIAYDPPVMAADGTLVLTGFGGLDTNLTLTAVGPVSLVDLSSTWDYTEAEDYLSFEDSTTAPGFQIRIYMSSSDLDPSGTTTGNFVYAGNSLAQGPISVSDFKIFPNYDLGGSTYTAATKGVNSVSAVLNIDSDLSCDKAEILTNYVFDPSVTNSFTGEFGMTMSPDARTYLSSTAPCKSVGTIDFRRMRLLVRGGKTNVGVYSSTLIIMIIDGL